MATPSDATDRDDVRRQIEQLRQRLDELERGEASAEEFGEAMPGMCPMCQGMMSGMGEMPGRRETESRIRDRVRELEDRIRGLETARA